MKKITITAGIAVLAAITFAGCDSNRNPGKVYMPDMAYSRAYESYAKHDSTKFTMDVDKTGGNMIFYNNMPVRGTIRRGDLFPYPLAGDSTGYNMSASIKNPFDSISKVQLSEAGRLFNINCAICHGEKGEGNGPLATSGKVGGVANLSTIVRADGTIFHVMTYGKGVMGSYASQLTRAQRWMIVKYVRTLQPKPAGAATAAAGTATGATTTTGAAATDTTKKS